MIVKLESENSKEWFDVKYVQIRVTKENTLLCVHVEQGDYREIVVRKDSKIYFMNIHGETIDRVIVK